VLALHLQIVVNSQFVYSVFVVDLWKLWSARQYAVAVDILKLSFIKFLL